MRELLEGEKLLCSGHAAAALPEELNEDDDQRWTSAQPASSEPVSAQILSFVLSSSEWSCC